jgi:hypothetical protein
LPTDSGDNPPNIGPLVFPILSEVIFLFPTEDADTPPDVMSLMLPVLSSIVRFLFTELAETPPGTCPAVDRYSILLLLLFMLVADRIGINRRIILNIIYFTPFIL